MPAPGWIKSTYNESRRLCTWPLRLHVCDLRIFSSAGSLYFILYIKYIVLVFTCEPSISGVWGWAHTCLGLVVWRVYLLSCDLSGRRTTDDMLKLMIIYGSKHGQGQPA